MKNIITQIKAELIQNSDEATKNSSHRFFKEEIALYGVKTSEVSKIAKKYFKLIKDCSKEEIFSYCEQLMQSGMIEESGIACNWSYELRKQYRESDLAIFEKWVNQYINNWASCDTLCNHTIGSFLEMYPQTIEKLLEWTNSQNRWVKRAAAVSLIIPAKHGLFFDEVLKIADRLLLDQDDLVQKGYGWMLKSACNKYEAEVFQYVLSKKEIMPRTALRYAIEKMPKEKKAEAMKR